MGRYEYKGHHIQIFMYPAGRKPTLDGRGWFAVIDGHPVNIVRYGMNTEDQVLMVAHNYIDGLTSSPA